MRGIAAIVVMLFHQAVHHGEPGILVHAYLAVDFFFVLSGFVLARTFEPRFAAGLGTLDFMVSRFRRLWPLISLGTMLGLVRLLLAGEPGNASLLLALGLAFIPHLAGFATLFPLNGPQWSLLAELIANFAHVTILRRASPPVLVAIALNCALGMLVAGIAFGGFNIGWQEKGIWAGPLRAGIGYCNGVILARSLDGCATSRSWSGLVPLLLLPTILVGLGLLSLDAAFLPGWGLMTVGFPLLVLLALRTGAPELAAPALNWLGRISFPLYAVHGPILELTELWARSQHMSGVLPRALALAIALVAAAGLAETRLGGKPKPGQARPLAPVWP